MDKYTVDLDQVLNDFEYSELTDNNQHQTHRGSKQAEYPTQPGYSCPSQTVTKHTISNVFNSLSEYLNSDITPKYKTENQINAEPLQNNLHTPTSSDYNSSFRSEFIDNNLKSSELGVKNSNVVAEQGISDKTAKSGNLSEFQPGNSFEHHPPLIQNVYFDNPPISADAGGDKSGETDLISGQSIISEPSSEIDFIGTNNEPNQTIISLNSTDIQLNNSKVDVNKSVNDLENSNAKFEINNVKINNNLIEKDNEQIANDLTESYTDKEELEKVENNIKLDNEIISKEDNDTEKIENEKADDNNVSEKYPHQNDPNTTSALIVDNLVIAEPIIDTEIKSEEIENPIKIIDESDECDSKINVKYDTEVNELAPVAVIKPVRFDDQLNLDENEIDKAFAELEEEFQSELHLEEGNEETGSNEKENALQLNPSSEENEQIENLESTALKTVAEELNKDDNQTVTNSTIEAPISTVTNYSFTSGNLSDKVENEQHKEIAVSNTTMENANFADEKQIAGPNKESDRPQDLAVKPVVADEEQRKIDLIGAPGSTPYNNVYINKEIPESNEKPPESESDYTSSTESTASSDESDTGSASTASTEALNDVDEKYNVPESKSVDNNQVEDNINSQTSETTPVASSSEGLVANNEENEPSASESNAELENSNISSEEVSSAPETPIVQQSSRVGDEWLGKQAPLWVPDSDALSCLHCDMKFNVIKRRHHCRACGLVLCSKCCNLRFKLEYLDQVVRVCNRCHSILSSREAASSSGSELSPDVGNSPQHRPNPNNPLEYCSTVSPLQQVDPNSQNPPPSVMVPVGVLKREGSAKGRSNKSVIFCDGIRPGSDLTNLDNDFDFTKKSRKSDKKVSAASNKNSPPVDTETNSFIPSGDNLPPVVTVFKTDISYTECANDTNTVELLKTSVLTFAIHVNFYVHLKIINMECCVNKIAWCFSTEGLINVGQDEIVILIEMMDDENTVPKDVFLHLNNIYFDAVKGTSVKETGVSLHNKSIFLDSKNHAGFVYIRPTFECLKNVLIPKEPYLIGILIHRWETPWAKLFPLRLILRLGAEYRYYPSPIISTRHRDSVFVEIGHTIINLLADFRNFTYTLPQIRGLTIHMEDKKTTVTIPINRYDQVVKSISNSSDHILAFAGNFSLQADSHLVCIQDTQGNENNYSTHAINIHNKPRKITGASFIVFNGALKSTSGLTAKSNIVEDGLMIQVLPEHMVQIRENLRNMKNHTIQCGCVNAETDETVHIVWGDNDVNFNIGVVSPIDNKSLSGIPSIRVHNGKDYTCNSRNRLIRWTEVFIIQNGEENSRSQDPVDISKVSESIAKAACNALVKYLDLLVSNNFYKIAIRTTLHVENVSYSAGSNNMKLPPIYMKSLDNELIPVLHRITSNNFGDNAIVLELILRILNL